MLWRARSSAGGCFPGWAVSGLAEDCGGWLDAERARIQWVDTCGSETDLNGSSLAARGPEELRNTTWSWGAPEGWMSCYAKRIGSLAPCVRPRRGPVDSRLHPLRRALDRAGRGAVGAAG